LGINGIARASICGIEEGGKEALKTWRHTRTCLMVSCSDRRAQSTKKVSKKTGKLVRRCCNTNKIQGTAMRGTGTGRRGGVRSYIWWILRFIYVSRL
jgi:hypothetical protein